YIPDRAISVTMIVTVTPPTGAAYIYAPGYEEQGTLFKGPKSLDEVRLDGPFVFVKLYGGATKFDIQYTNYRQPVPQCPARNWQETISSDRDHAVGLRAIGTRPCNRAPAADGDTRHFGETSRRRYAI